MDDMALPTRFAEAMKLHAELGKMLPRDADYPVRRDLNSTNTIGSYRSNTSWQAAVARVERALQIAVRQVRELGLISANETYHEHSTATLRHAENACKSTR